MFKCCLYIKKETLSVDLLSQSLENALFLSVVYFILNVNRKMHILPVDIHAAVKLIIKTTSLEEKSK